MIDQDKVFLDSEGDQWFTRNANAIHSKGRLDQDIPLKMLAMLPDLKPKKVLEIGCSNGYRLGEIQKKYNPECVGIEPSGKAIEDGQKLYPQVKFHQGVAASIPIKNQKFDLVLVCFVLHWVGRSSLLQSVAEIDRMVEEGGYLLVGDFLPDVPSRRKYHHLDAQDVYTYKQDYAQLFLSSCLYQRVTQVTFDQDTGEIMAATESGRRGTHTLLRKIPKGTYIDT